LGFSKSRTDDFIRLARHPRGCEVR
jgi:hypothetical protein